jgi:hypothetical protein
VPFSLRRRDRTTVLESDSTGRQPALDRPPRLLPQYPPTKEADVLTTHQAGQRLAVLAALCLTLALMTAANVAAYPITPDGDPLYLGTAPTQQSLAPDPVLEPVDAGAVTPQSTVSELSPIETVSSSAADWSSVISVIAGASLAALAVIAAAFVLTGRRNRPPVAPPPTQWREGDWS